MRNFLLVLRSVMTSLHVLGIDNKGITFRELSPDRFTLIENGVPGTILINENEDAGVMTAAANLRANFVRIPGNVFIHG